jgi:hypothetical protein
MSEWASIETAPQMRKPLMPLDGSPTHWMPLPAPPKDTN